MSDATCSTCAAYAKAWPDGERKVTCGECGATLERVLAPRPRTRSARVEMATLAKWRPTMIGRASDPCPMVVGDGNRGGGHSQALSGRGDRVDEDSRGLRRAIEADARLNEMRRHGGDGPRFADIVWFVYGIRGEIVNQRESCAKAVAERFGTREVTNVRDDEAVVDQESEAMQWKRADKARSKLKGDLLLIAFGNDLIGAAVAAYELDEWRVLVKLRHRDEFVRSVADRWAKIRHTAAIKAT